MSRRAWVAALVAASILCALAVLWWTLVPRQQVVPGEGPGIREPEPGEAVRFTLYFPGAAGQLEAEERELAVEDGPRGRARSLVLALLDGPRESGHFRPFPEEVGLLDLYLGPEGVAFVDLGGEGEGLEAPPPGGSLEEMVRVYSVVETLVANLPEVRSVALLWNGRQRESFSGHLDTSRPLFSKEDLLAPSARRERTG